MWKKTDVEEPQRIEVPPPPRVPSQPLKEHALIGPSLIVKGEILGDEDLMIQGTVEGKVELRKNSVTVGRSGHVKADIYGKSIQVEGEVQGNLFGEEKIVVRQSGQVRGNLSAPRVTLEDGAQFKGSIDMDGKEKQRLAAPEPPLISKAAGENKEPGVAGNPLNLSLKVNPSSANK